MAKKTGDLSITALYTSGVWAWAELPNAELFANRDTERVFGATENVMALARWFNGGPSLKHSLVQRHVLIDQLTEDSQPDKVVELAAGMSRRGATLSAELPYVEVDMPGVIERKTELAERTQAGRDVLGRSTLEWIGSDVREVDLPGLVEGRTTVIAEGLLMYLDAPAQRELWHRIASALSNGTFLFDLVPAVEQPPPGLIGRFLGWLMRKFTGGRGFIVDARTREDIRAELLTAGFDTVRWIEPADHADRAMPHLEETTQTLIFECRRGVVAS